MIQGEGCAYDWHLDMSLLLFYPFLYQDAFLDLQRRV